LFSQLLPLRPDRIHHPPRVARAGTPVRCRFCIAFAKAKNLLRITSYYGLYSSSPKTI
jgi:hypothetical protein